MKNTWLFLICALGCAESPQQASLPMGPPLSLMTEQAKPARIEQVDVRSGQILAQVIAKLLPAKGELTALMQSLQTVFEAKRIRPGDKVTVTTLDGKQPATVEIRRGLRERYLAKRDLGGVWNAKRDDPLIEREVIRVHGNIETSLWDAVVGQGEKPGLVADIVDIFAWDLDFYSDVHPHDTFSILVEKETIEGQFAGYGPIAAAEFVSLGKAHRAFRFGEQGYYDQDGKSLKKQLLKTPLEYAPITSGFGNRRHPILGYNRKHSGTDYGAQTGTPVWSVGDGRVITAGKLGGYGNCIEVAHNNGWSSLYGHLSKINVHIGERVSQRQMIGRVGSTGMSTGPHLHYGLKRQGVFVNPAAQKFDRGQPLKGVQRTDFLKQVERDLKMLTPIELS